jgi:hypothetical protein
MAPERRHGDRRLAVLLDFTAKTPPLLKPSGFAA